MTSSMTGISLPECLNAIWACLDHHPQTRSLFRRTYRFDDQDDQHPQRAGLSLDPSIGDLPACMVLQTATDPDRLTNYTDKDVLVYGVTLWSANWNQYAALRIWESVRESLYTTKHPAASADTYISAPHTGTEPPGTGFLVQAFRLNSSQRTLIGAAENTPGSKAWITQSELVLHRTAQVHGRIR
jgi:hypothetical protein